MYVWRKNLNFKWKQKNSGTEEYYGLMGKVDIINSTLGKALGGAAGGYSKLF